jgi:hypothetical protein
MPMTKTCCHLPLKCHSLDNKSHCKQTNPLQIKPMQTNKYAANKATANKTEPPQTAAGGR